VRTGDWVPMLAGFDDDAEMEFQGVPVGPFRGRAAIAEAYRAQPPDDELRLLELREREGRTEARYAWLAEPGVSAGELILTAEDGLIRKLVITFDRGVIWS
jgi:steroid delta-isomerase